jgi:hypothetical protein
MIDNDTASYNKTNFQKDINVIPIMSDDARKLYRTANPFGIGYTDHYSHVLISKKAVTKLYGGNSKRKIDFLEVS